MSASPRRSRRLPRPDDRGSSVLLVMACLTAMAVFATVALSMSVGSLKFADRQTSWNQALAAAEAGVADYLSRLNKDDGYWQKVDCTNKALKGSKTGSNTCGWNSSTPAGWQTVTGMPNASFHYDVNTTSTYTNGAVRVTSTGRVDGITRSVDVRLRRGGFGEFLYYTVYETLDPADERSYGINNTTAATQCTRYDWPTLPTSQRRTSMCLDINFITGDVINGPLHTNDAFRVIGTPRFKGTTTTSNPRCRSSESGPPPTAYCYVNGGSANPTFERGIAYRAEIELPTTIGDLRKYVTPGQTPTPGCLYTGQTRIKFLPVSSSSAVQQMTVWSKASGQTASPTLNNGCGTKSALASAAGATIPVPQNNLILVQDVPSGQSYPTTSQCKTTSTTHNVGDGLPLAGTTGTYPDFDLNLNFAESNCRYGSAWVEGSLKGRLTIATDNNIIVTNNLTYFGGRTGTDSLGLIAKNSVRVYHPVKCTRKDDGECDQWANMAGSKTNIEIQAAILTLQHSFSVQMYYRGSPLGSLKLFGSFAQRFRGPVGTNSSGGSIASGYLKDYTYDTRLRYAPPPYFLDPVRSGWSQKTFGEVVPRY
jgi:Tfp pilus assembly protein PilX